MIGAAYPALYSRGAGGADMNKNGETAFLEWLVGFHASRKIAFVCFDVGANVGHYSSAVLDTCRKNSVPCELHAFEPVAKSFAELARMAPASPSSFIPNNIALSDDEGEITMHYDQAGSSLASIYKRDIGIAFDGSEKIRALTGKAYMARNSVQEISLLKIDVEGHELRALEGFKDMLTPERIHFIQFEYGGSYRDSATTLKEAYAILTRRGYAVGRLLRDRVEIRDFIPSMEDFAYSNYVALDPAHIKSAILPTLK